MKSRRRYTGKVFMPKKAVETLYAEMPALTIILAPSTTIVIQESK